MTMRRLVIVGLVGLVGISGAADAAALPAMAPQAGGVVAPMQAKGSRVVVTAGALNVRSGPSTKYRSVKVVRRGHVFTTTGRVSGGWTQVDGGRWVSSRYLKKTAAPKPAPKPAGAVTGKGSRVVVTAGALNVRSGPSTKYRSVKVVRRGHVFTTTGRVSGGWTQVDGGRWVSSRYLKKIAAPKPAPKPARKPVARVSGDCRITVEGVPVTLKKSQQSVTVAKTSGTRATVTMVKRKPGTQCGVQRVFRDTSGRIGYGGAVPAAKRRQGTGTTPQGTFSVTEGFGLKANPGTRLPYRVPGKNSYWVLDSRSAFYNQWRESSQGGFRTGPGERLRDFPGQYNYSAVINYNRWPAVKGKGGAIFLHVHGRGATGGCVSITEANMKNFLRHVSAGDTITIR